MAQWRIDEQKYRAPDTTNFEVVMLADEDGNIINSSGAASNIPIAAGQLNGYSHINKFGYASDIATPGSNFVTIWDAGTVYSYATTATIASVVSTDPTGDAGAVITVIGLDENYNNVSEDITIGGAAGTKLFIRVFRALVKTPAAGETCNVGKINISIDGAIRAEILADAGQTLMALYTIPAGKTGYILKIQANPNKNTSATFRLRIREFDPANGAFQVKAQFGTFGVPVLYEYPVPLRFPEKTDIEIMGAAGNTCSASAIFDIIMVDNPS